METQNFVEIKNLNGYLINDMGVVFSKKSGKELKTNNGSVEVYVDGVKRKKNVAHLVLETFVGRPQNASRAHYKNGDRNDSSLSNVEWVISNNTKSGAAKTTSKRSSSRMKEIAKRRKELKMTQEELANKLHVTNKTISRWENGIS